jgi:RNA polymerase sigma-70 factor, ECF subfamily
MSDRQLMEAVQAGDSEAVQLLVERYRKRIFKYLYGWIKNYEDALDVTQEVLMTVYQKAHLYNSSHSLTAWIYRIAHNLCIDHLRRETRRGHAGAVEFDESLGVYAPDSATTSPEQIAMGKEIISRVKEAIEELPTRQREVLQLRLLGELSLEEIAETLGLTLGGVKSNLHVALQNLRRHLTDLEGHHVRM